MAILRNNVSTFDSNTRAFFLFAVNWAHDIDLNIELLIEAECSVDVELEYGSTPVETALRSRSRIALTCFIRNQANVSIARRERSQLQLASIIRMKKEALMIAANFTQQIINYISIKGELYLAYQNEQLQLMQWNEVLSYNPQRHESGTFSLFR